MKTGHLYFVIDEFYQKYDPNKMLMCNKEAVNGQNHDRPCFFALRDSRCDEIFWLVPLSSKVEKYKKIVKQKIKKMKSQHKKNPQCNTIRFGEVMGLERAFLIQNMFPITEKYIKNTYIDRNTHNEVTLSPEVTDDIIKNAKQVLKLHSRGIKLTYGDIDTVFSSLKEEIAIEKSLLPERTSPSNQTLDINEKRKNTIHMANAILNENPELKRQFIEAKKKYLQKQENLVKEKPISPENNPNKPKHRR